MRSVTRLGVVVVAISAVAGCELRKPFDATIVAAGADGKKVKVGIFRAEDTVQPEEGDPVTLRIDTDQASQGRPLWNSAEPALATLELEPLQIDDEGVGHTVIDLLSPPPKEGLPIHIFAWADVDDDDKLDLSATGDSEVARTIYKFNAESNGKAVLAFYNFVADADPFYTATALEGDTNVIVTEDFLTGWMAVLPGNLEAAPPAPDSDGDGLDDNVESRIGTSTFEVDTDFDGEDDKEEVGDDVNAPLDTDGDTIVDALESSASDFDADGLDAETDVDDANECVPELTGASCDADAAGTTNGDEDFLGLNRALADSDSDTLDDLLEVGNVFSPNDSDFDGTIDALETDSDNDGVNDSVELLADVDGDGTPAYRDADET